MTKLGSVRLCTVGPIYWHQVVVNESVAFIVGHQARSTGSWSSKAQLPNGFQWTVFKDTVREKDNRGWDDWMASPTQWTCLGRLRELVMDREACCATANGDTKSQTWLSTELNWGRKLLLLLLSHFSCVPLCATPWTAAHQAPPSLVCTATHTNYECKEIRYIYI